jgi:hypothetical protein
MAARRASKRETRLVKGKDFGRYDDQNPHCYVNITTSRR